MKQNTYPFKRRVAFAGDDFSPPALAGFDTTGGKVILGVMVLAVAVLSVLLYRDTQGVTLALGGKQWGRPAL